MDRPLLTETICFTGAHCGRCRRFAEFRANVAASHVVPAGWPACPRGLPLIAAAAEKSVTHCNGCGGAKYREADFNHPGGADELIQQLG